MSVAADAAQRLTANAVWTEFCAASGSVDNVRSEFGSDGVSLIKLPVVGTMDVYFSHPYSLENALVDWANLRMAATERLRLREKELVEAGARATVAQQWHEAVMALPMPVEPSA